MTGVGRIGGSHGAQMLQRGVEIALLAQRHPQVQMGGHAVRLQRQRLLEHRHRLGRITALGQHGAEIGVGPPVFRIEGDGLPERGDGAGKIGLFREGDAQPVVRLRGARPDLDRALERLERARGVVPLPVRQAQRDIQLGIGGIGA